MPMIEVTVKEIIDAIEKNGYTQLKGTWVSYDIDGKLAGCAIGQGAINLGVQWSGLTDKLNTVTQKRKDLAKMGNLIMYLNDKRGKTIPEIVEQLRAKFGHQLDTSFSLRTHEYYVRKDYE